MKLTTTCKFLKDPMQSILALGCLLLTFSFLASCSTTYKPSKPTKGTDTTQATQATPPAEPTKSIEQLMIKAGEADSPKKEAYLLKAVQMAMEDQTYQRAKQIYDFISPIQTYQSPRLAFYYEKIGADLHLSMNELAEAGERLSAAQQVLNKSALELTEQETKSYFKTNNQYFEATGNHLSLARLSIFSITDQESQSELQITHDNIWNALVKVPEHELQQILVEAQGATPHQDYKAWLNLAFLMKSGNANITDQIKLLRDWHTRWAHTKVATTPPSSIQHLMKAEFKQYKHVALLLPSAGPFKFASKAILEGVLTSHYKHLEQVPDVSLSVYDTDQYEDVTQLYQKAVDEGAEFIIGPLQKNKVTAISAQKEFPVPILVLNYVNNPTSKREDTGNASDEDFSIPNDHLEKSPSSILSTGPKNIAQFGLRAEDEAIQVAREGRSLGHKRALVLYPNSDWGFRMASAFNDTWVEGGGYVVAMQAFTKPEHYSKEIKQALNITASENRKRALSRRLRLSLEFEPRRRKDVDMIFLAASPVQARQLKPTLNFHYAEGIAVYATSHVYEGFEDTQKNLDLENIFFLDIPWIISAKSEGLKAYFHETWPNQTSPFKRLHALGIDAYRLMQHFSLVENMPKVTIQGATGLLHVDQEKVVHRELSWATFKKGKVITVKPKNNLTPVTSSGLDQKDNNNL